MRQVGLVAPLRALPLRLLLRARPPAPGLATSSRRLRAVVQRVMLSPAPGLATSSTPAASCCTASDAIFSSRTGHVNNAGCEPLYLVGGFVQVQAVPGGGSLEDFSQQALLFSIELCLRVFHSFLKCSIHFQSGEHLLHLACTLPAQWHIFSGIFNVSSVVGRVAFHVSPGSAFMGTSLF